MGKGLSRVCSGVSPIPGGHDTMRLPTRPAMVAPPLPPMARWRELPTTLLPSGRAVKVFSFFSLYFSFSPFSLFSFHTNVAKEQ